MQTNYDAKELKKFSKMRDQWWDETGPMKTLHHLNPLRIQYINNKIALKGKKVLDIGCGGGILSEALAKEGAIVTGIDLEPGLIHVAKQHAANSYSIDYQCISVEGLATAQHKTYDIITCLELLEHIPNPLSLIQAIKKLAKPHAQLFFSTINRTLKAYFFAIIGAEYILNVLPKGTHDYAKLIRPSELVHWLNDEGIEVNEIKGVKYNPFNEQVLFTDDLSINYLLHAVCL